MVRHAAVRTAMIAMVLVIALAGTVSAASDVHGHWAAGYIDAALEQGMVQAYSDGTFRPDEPITRGDLATLFGKVGTYKVVGQPVGVASREEAAKIIVESLGKVSNAAALSATEINAILGRFEDDASISAEFKPYVAFAVKQGILSGKREGTAFAGVFLSKFAPKAPLSRAEAAVLGVRTLRNQTVEVAYGGMGYGQDDYVGSETCQGCHIDKYDSWAHTLHAKMIRNANEPGVFMGDLSKLPDKSYVSVYKQADLVLTGPDQQRYLAKGDDGKHYYLPFNWNMETEQWTGSANPSWDQGTPWEASCAGCHTTGFAAATGTFSEAGIGCESCHGPGLAHVRSGGDVNTVQVFVEGEDCAQCHDDRQSVQLASMGHSRSLADFYTNDHGNASCSHCMSREGFIYGEVATVAEMQHSITCDTCHDPHGVAADGPQLRLTESEACIDCHNGHIAEGTALAPGSSGRHTQKEMYLGFGAIGVSNTAAAHYQGDVECQDCHMYTWLHAPVGGHTFAVITPEEAMENGYPGDSCSSCHQSSTAEGRQVMLSTWQDTTRAKMAEVEGILAKVKSKLNAAPNASAQALYDKAFSNVSFVQADGSMGAHNFDYALKILDQAKKDASQALVLVSQ